MAEEPITSEELRDLIEVFRLLRKWRDERNALMLEQEVTQTEEPRSYNANQY
jgi:hypothetical protein